MQTGYNLVVCAFALGDKEGMKYAFQQLIKVPPYEVGGAAGRALGRGAPRGGE